ncbi:DUF4856 domain-containing protein [Flammeovirga kamogawensis]|uniref:DUF4856 domain-containing protein n=1 Tax=Flammeovirga kamogawensis TaxID=373891 RepID=A0ABX8GXS4_9BACT|nr:DUF4856 domain-containing protein [Flammeovirga kamogawensis]MBB6460779.1 hypothetical protein [Flammeovirga kamogawensis]QWG08132.1 DUF4856 domain-containing protein [Flammeovirga kamogawensis]TRX69935.1 DUF4856 domain-containing protein [Flammeovirga kamogawensis]
MTISSSLKKTFIASSLIATSLFSCSEVEDAINDVITPDVPTTYTFEHVNYSGQTARIQMLDSLERYIKSGNDGVTKLEIDDMVDIYTNKSEGLFGSSKDLKSKTYGDEDLHVDVKDEVDGYFTKAYLHSGKEEFIIGGRLFDSNGHEPAQMVAKGLMGATLYYQSVSNYLTNEKLDGADNETVEEGDGTAMEHYWDEGFGYFGAAEDYATNEDAKNWYWAKYAKSRAGVYDVSGDIFNAFIAGRVAIAAKDYDERNKQRDIIVAKWEELVAINVIHYLNSLETDTELGDQMHHWSEALAFAWCLQYNASKVISTEDLNTVIDLLGDSVDDVSSEDIASIKTSLQTTYGFSTEVVNNL